MKNLNIRNFGKIKDDFELPQLLDIQTKSYEDFLQRKVNPEKRRDHGLEEVFREVFPLESYDGQIKLEYISYYLGKEKHEEAMADFRAVVKIEKNNTDRYILIAQALRGRRLFDESFLSKDWRRMTASICSSAKHKKTRTL